MQDQEKHTNVIVDLGNGNNYYTTQEHFNKLKEKKREHSMVFINRLADEITKELAELK